ncbi:MAG: putative transport system permease protein [Candidatus Dependentiae bacterium]|nr:putative transport system permease protein [Candidatus Dependentiae bacterium]
MYIRSWFLLETAISSLSRHKGRSLLTILSIIIGIATVIATLAIGRGAQEKIRDRLANLGTNLLSVYAGSPNFGGPSAKEFMPLTTHDVDFFRSFDPRIRAVSGVCRYKETDVLYQNKKIGSSISGVEPTALHINNRQLNKGRNFLVADMQTYAPHVIVGYEVARTLFGCSNPLGKVVTIEEKKFTVIGVLEEKESPYTFHNINKEVFLPLTTCKRLMGRQNNVLHTIIMSIDEKADITQVERLLKRALRARHRIGTKSPDDFTIWNQSSMMAAAEQSSQTFNLFLLIVASLSLFVGGLGVSNIMLVTVTERTKEIGIRMALGASPTIILAQFLVESVILCLIGGFIGTLLGILVPHIVALFTDWNVVVSLSSILLSVIITSMIGLFFGFWPARRASRLTIVDALNDQ